MERRTASEPIASAQQASRSSHSQSIEGKSLSLDAAGNPQAFQSICGLSLQTKTESNTRVRAVSRNKECEISGSPGTLQLCGAQLRYKNLLINPFVSPKDSLSLSFTTSFAPFRLTSDAADRRSPAASQGTAERRGGRRRRGGREAAVQMHADQGEIESGGRGESSSENKIKANDKKALIWRIWERVLWLTV